MDDATANRSQHLLSTLSHHLSRTFPERAATIVQDIEDTARPIRAANQSRIVDEPSKHHLELTSLILASYRVLVPIMQDHEAMLALLRNVIAAPVRSQMQTYLTQRFGIDPTVPAQAFDAAAENFKQRGELRYGKAFQYEQEVQTPEQSFVNIHRCFFNDFFRANGAPELTPLFCFMDTLWADALHEGEYNVRFERPTTLAAGDDMCRFQFSRAVEDV